MKKTHKLLIALLGVIVLTVAGFRAMQPKEPEYQGRRLSEWLEAFEDGKTEQQEKEAVYALRSMGNKALLVLVAKIDDGSPPWMYRLRLIIAKTGLFISRKDNSGAACMALIALESDAYPAIPSLVTKLGVVRSEETLIILVLREMGTAAVPELSQALRSQSDVLRYRAITVLRLIGPDATNAIPDLLAIRKTPRFKAAADAAIRSIAPKIADELKISSRP